MVGDYAVTDSQRKLVVAGCSVSDRGNANICYGDALSELLNVPYIHHGSGCGSNYRIWRVITNMILNNELTSNDQLIIQYTTVNRREFWTSNWVPEDQRTYNSKENSKNNTGIVQLVEQYKDDGLLVKYKRLADTWQTNKQTAGFFKQYNEQFSSNEYDYDLFRINHYNFSNMLKANNINVLFVSMFGYCGTDIIKEVSCGYPVLRIGLEDMDPEHRQEDQGHFTDSGHRYAAQLIRDAL